MLLLLLLISIFFGGWGGGGEGVINTGLDSGLCGAIYVYGCDVTILYDAQNFLDDISECLCLAT